MIKELIHPNSSLQEIKQKLRLVNLLSLLLSLPLLNSCTNVEIQNGKICSVAGVLSAGGICSDLLDAETSDMTMDQFLYFLEAHPATATAPAQGAAMCMSSTDWGNMKTSLETACRILGKKCTYQMKQILNNLK